MSAPLNPRNRRRRSDCSLAKRLFLTRKLKAAADPRAVFRELDAAAQDRPGARAWGMASRGLDVTIGAGFDFGPLLTFGSPAVIAEVGVSVTCSGSTNLSLMLERQASGSLQLRRMTGYSVGLTGILEAKVGVGIPEEWGQAATAMVPDVPTRGLKAKVEEHGKANPLVVEEGGEGEEAEEPAEPPDEKSVEDSLDQTAEDEEAADEPEPPVDDSSADAADKVFDLKAVAQGEVSAGLRYLVVRDPAPVSGNTLEDLDAAMATFISHSEKAAIKEEAHELLAESTAAADAAKSLAAVAAWLELVPERSRTPECKRLIERVEQQTELSKKLALLTSSALDGLIRRLRERYLLADSALRKASDLASFVTTTVERPEGSERETRCFPNKLEYDRAVALLQRRESSSWKASSDKDAWKQEARQLLRRATSIFGPPDGQHSDWLIQSLKRTQLAGASTNYTKGVGKGPGSTRDLHDEVVTVVATANELGWQPDTSAADAASKALVKEARRWISANAALVPNPPERKWLRTMSAAGLVDKLNEVVQLNPARTDAAELAIRLTAVKAAERVEVKARAIQILQTHAPTSLPTWGTPAATVLAEQLQRLITNPPSPRPTGFGDWAPLLDELKRIKAEKDEKNAPSNPRAGLCYLTLLGTHAAAAASLSAKAVGRFAIGPNELGGHAKASAEVEVRQDWLTARLQGFEEQGTEVVVQTQDVKVRRFVASAKVAATAKVVNKTAHEVEKGVEVGRVRWSGATARWKLPAAETKSVELLIGSGLCFGRSAGRERFAKKLAALRLANPLEADGSRPAKLKSTAYVRRLATALRVPADTLVECLLDLCPTADDVPSEEHEVLYFESRWTLPKLSAFPVRRPSLFLSLFRSSETRHTPPTDVQIHDVRKALQRRFKRYPTQFRLQSIAIRVKVGDEPEESERTLLQVAHEYIVVAQVAVVAKQSSSTTSMPDQLVWWSDPTHRDIEADPADTRRAALLRESVPPLFVVDV